MKSPGKSEAWLRGWGDCNKGVEKHRNPYMDGDHTDETKYDDWRKGWESRYYNDPSEEW